MANVWDAKPLQREPSCGVRGSLRLKAASFLALLLTPIASQAVDPERFLSQYSHTAWRVQDGDLPAPPFPIGQTIDGYLWVGTQSGLVRFDGVRFVPFTQLASSAPTSPKVFALLGAQDGSLWIGSDKGLSRWKDDRLVEYADSTNEGDFVVEERSGKIWFASSKKEGRGLCEVVDTHVRCRGKEDGFDDEGKFCCGKIVTDGAGTFWATAYNQVIRWHEGTQSKALPLPGKVAGPAQIALEPNGDLWVGVSESGAELGLHKLVDDVWQGFSSQGVDGSTLATSFLLRDHHGALWVGTVDRGIYRIVADRVDHLDHRDGLSSDFVRLIFEDHVGNIWISTSKGVDRLRDFVIPSFTAREGLGADEVDSVLAGRDGRIWVGTPVSLDIIDRNSVRSITTREGLPGQQVTAIVEDRAGRLWVGVDTTLSIYSAGKFKPVPGLDGKPMGFVLALTQDSEGDVWATVREKPLTAKLVRVRDDRVIEELKEPAIPSPRSLAADPNGGVWLGLTNGNIAHLGSRGFESYGDGKGPSVSHLAVAASGIVFGATNTGLVALKDGALHKLASQQGLPCDRVQGVIEDDRHILWLQMSCGQARIAQVEIDRYIADSSHRVVVETISALDGMIPGGGPFNSAARAPDGKIWLASGSVLQMADPLRPREAAVIPVYVEWLLADHKPYSFNASPTLPALTRDVQIDYTALDLAVPQRLRFRYRLDGRDDGWVDAATRRQAFYTDLPPGEYTFHVSASADADKWSEPPATVRFAILPAFYQTPWFPGLVAIAAGVILWLIFAWQIGQVKARMRARLQERIGERERIARELHDTFLQSVQGLMLRFQSALYRIPPEHPARSPIETALDHADAVLAEGRDRVTQMRSQQDATIDLSKALQDIGEDFSRDAATRFQLASEGQPHDLDPVVCDEVLRIVGEAMTNAFRHANATRVEVNVTYRRHELAVSVVDDGRGFDTETANADRPPGHWGLQGMDERAQRIGARLRLSSRRDIGTAVEIVVPASVAYRRSGSAGWWTFKRTR